MTVNRLHLAYCPEWIDDSDFSHEVAQLLDMVFIQLQSDDSNARLLFVLLTVIGIQIQRPASEVQRMQLYCVLGEICWKLDLSAEAAACFDEALSLAESLGDWGARAELAYRRGLVDCALFNYGVAADYFDLSLDSLYAFVERSSLDTSAFALEADVQLALALSKFAQADYDVSALCLKRCHTLASLTPKHRRLLAKTLRIHALVLRWQGQPQQALHHAHEASQYLTDACCDTSLRSYGRLELEMADMLLDSASGNLAKRSILAKTYIEEASFHVRSAEHYASRAADTVGLYLTQLTRARLDCVTKLDADWVPVIENVLKYARQYNDPALTAQAYTTLACVLAAFGDPEASLNCHRAAIATSNIHQIPAMAKWSQNALVFESAKL